MLNGVIVVVCTFNYRLWKKNLHKLPVMSKLAEVEIPTYASSTWTIPGTVAVLTGRQEWENPQEPELAWTNLGWNEWADLDFDHGVGDARKLVDEWDRTGTAHLFYRIPHAPYGLDQEKAMLLAEAGNHERLEEAYLRRLQWMDYEMEPLLELDVPIMVTGDHGEDFSARDQRYAHHNNDSFEVLQVPTFGKNVRGGITGGPFCNKHAQRFMHFGKYPYDYSTPGDVTEIWTEGPMDDDWKFITIHGGKKIVVDRDGFNYNDSYHSSHDVGKSNLHDRLKALGYL